MSEMRAYAYRSGRIEISKKGRSANDALVIAVGPAKELREEISGLARHGYDGKTLLVPGIPEARTDSEAMDALFDFKAKVEAGLANQRV